MDKRTHAMRRYEIVRDEDEFRALQAEWDALWTKAHGYYYQSFSFCWLAWRYVSKSLGRKLGCIVCRENGRIVLIWPLETFRRSLWTYLAPLGPQGGDFTSMLVEEDAATAERVEGAWEAARQRFGADFIHLPYVRERLHLHKLVMQERRLLIVEPHNASTAKLQGQGSWDEYCSTLGTLFGKRPGRFTKKLAKEGTVAVRVLDPSEQTEAAAVIKWMFDCKRGWSERVRKHSVWLDLPEFELFLRKLIYSGEVPSMGRLIVVTLNDKPVAGIIASLGNPWASAIFAGFDANYSKCCPGLIAVEECVKWAFESGYDVDFGVGTEDFKAYWSRGESTTAWTVQTINSTWGLMAIRGRRAARKLIAQLKGRADGDGAGAGDSVPQAQDSPQPAASRAAAMPFRATEALRRSGAAE
jgi:CelD/BcsL family acetyltransferase involved in cellulose biosynthesis